MEKQYPSSTCCCCCLLTFARLLPQHCFGQRGKISACPNNGVSGMMAPPFGLPPHLPRQLRRAPEAHGKSNSGRRNLCSVNFPASYDPWWPKRRRTPKRKQLKTSQTLNSRLPPEDGSVWPETWPKPVSGDPRHFIVRRPKQKKNVDFRLRNLVSRYLVLKG